ncbi:MAG: hypothetical protein GX022_01360 [Clostridiaceae bacterium]|nr:hypothetical protein [Clostridiaceae bacterium]
MDIAVIGGADSPTKVFLSSGTYLYAVLPVVLLCVLVSGIIIWNKKKRKN